MTILWVTAFVDIPGEVFEREARFWGAVTNSTLSARRGEHEEFATLVLPDGDAYLRVQRLGEGNGGVHLDFHVKDIAAFVRRAEGLGAGRADRGGTPPQGGTTTQGGAPPQGGTTTMRSPGGFVFCVVSHRGEVHLPSARIGPGGVPSLVDQVSLDIPHGLFEDETRFWSELTEWDLTRSVRRPEFALLARPSESAVRVVLQRLGEDDAGSATRAHLDVSCGSEVDQVAAEHVTLGSTVQRVERFWTTMTDPGGLEYCLTRRDPETGLVS